MNVNQLQVQENLEVEHLPILPEQNDHQPNDEMIHEYNNGGASEYSQELLEVPLQVNLFNNRISI